MGFILKIFPPAYYNSRHILFPNYIYLLLLLNIYFLAEKAAQAHSERVKELGTFLKQERSRLSSSETAFQVTHK